ALRSATKTACRSSNPNPGYTKFCTPSSGRGDSIVIWRAYLAVDRWLVDINVGVDIMERLLESIYINARPAMEFKLSLTSSGRKKIVKIVDGDEVEMLPGDVQSILESQKMDVGILSDFFVQTLLERR
ncbi:hypothetical protein OFL72_17230, partial [Pseudomonas aeruginosa]|nr:hypothetical protein [Pseudomonas aeruginosa]MCV6463991.1 hypothetical protein [Pseudomonas aeruginosa]